MRFNEFSKPLNEFAPPALTGALKGAGRALAKSGSAIAKGADDAVSDIGKMSSTGGQTFTRPGSTMHFSNPNNPNRQQNIKSVGSTALPAPVPAQLPAPDTAAPKTAPSLGAPQAVQQQQAKQDTPQTQIVINPNNPQAEPPEGEQDTGFLSGIAKGFKQGIGVNPSQSLAQGLAGKGLKAAGFRSTANTVANGASPTPGSTIKTGKFGDVKVLPNAPGQKGIHLDTTKTLGHPIYVDPKDIE